MKKYDIALFDLDGTLSESGEGILFCVRKIFEETGRTVPEQKILDTFIGPPMYDSLRRCGFSHEDAENGVEIYKRNFLEKGIYMQKTYEGIVSLLRALKALGVRLGVATTKYYPFAEKIIKMLGLDEYFDFVGGATADTERRTKAKVISYTLEMMGSEEKDRVVMVGDTKYDAEGAAAAGVDFIGCLYGYGTKQEMESFFKDAFYVNSPEEIYARIAGQV